MSVCLVLVKGCEKLLFCCYLWVFFGVVVCMEGKVSFGEIIDIVDYQGKWLVCGVYLPALQIWVCVWMFDLFEFIDIVFFFCCL